jgi:hypothetical protein
MDSNKTFSSLKEFYPYYLKEHQNVICRRLHFIGTSLTLLSLVLFIISIFLSVQWFYLVVAPLWGYGFAWVGHFFFEKNKPATFKYPLYSLASDFILYFQIIAGKQKL